MIMRSPTTTNGTRQMVTQPCQRLDVWPSDADLEEFQSALEWRTGYPLPDGRYLGWHAGDPDNYHRKWSPGLDSRVAPLIK